MSMLHLAGKASIRRRPVNSALGLTKTHMRHTSLPRLLSGLAPLGLAATVVCAMAPVAVARAQSLEGTKSITLQTGDGNSIRIGTVNFTKASGGGYGFSLHIDSGVFSDHFLSMKEFKCLGGTPELMCLVPYPYKSSATIGEADFAWLEHSLLFMFKRPSDFGAKLWNGVYFQLARTPRGLAGTPQAVDLNYISAPPSNLSVPPFKRALREDYPANSRWVRSISIE
jgi:hypothetical protein